MFTYLRQVFVKFLYNLIDNNNAKYLLCGTTCFVTIFLRLHAVSRTQQSRLREFRVKALCCRRIFQGIACWVAEHNAGLLPWCQIEEMKILINNNHSFIPNRDRTHNRHTI